MGMAKYVSCLSFLEKELGVVRVDKGNYFRIGIVDTYGNVLGSFVRHHPANVVN